MWNIKQNQNHSFDCLTGLLTAFADCMNVDYRFCFSKNLGFYFWDTEGKLLSEKIHFCRPYSFFDMYEKYCNIYISERKHDDLCSLKNYSRNTLETSPVIFEVDAFNCPWCPVYKKFHFDHHLMIVDINENSFFCFDSYFPEKGIQKLSFPNLLNWSGSSKTLKIIEQPHTYNGFKYYFEIKETVAYLEHIDYILQLKKFQKYMSNEDDLFCNFKGYETGPNHAPFFLILRTLVMQKKQFLLVLDFLKDICTDNEYKIIDEIIVLYNEIKNLYSSIHTICLKQIISKKKDTSGIVALFDKIIEKEELALSLLKECTSNQKS